MAQSEVAQLRAVQAQAKKLAELRQVRAQTQKEIAETIYALYPVDAPISWDHHGYLQEGTVTHHGYNGTLKVFNIRTEKEIWVREEQIR